MSAVEAAVKRREDVHTHPSSKADVVMTQNVKPIVLPTLEPEPQAKPAEPVREEISFEGGIFAGDRGDHGTLCTVSFPGVSKAQWDALVRLAKLGRLSTACVFITSIQMEVLRVESRLHCTNPEGADGECWCHALYGEPKFWGCRWFEDWRALVDQAQTRGQILVVFYHAGWLRDHGCEYSSWAPGGGGSGLRGGVGGACRIQL